MSKSVVVLSSTPRKGGNSDLLCDQFIKGAREAGHHVEKIALREKKIGCCLGCEACQKNGGICVLKDDMAEILDKIVVADVLVMASPVYFYTMCAQMKALIDRTVARFAEIRERPLEFYFIATAADPNKQAMERTFDGFRGFTACLNHAIEKGMIHGCGAWQQGDIKSSAAMNEAHVMGKGV